LAEVTLFIQPNGTTKWLLLASEAKVDDRRLAFRPGYRKTRLVGQLDARFDQQRRLLFDQMRDK
jgi:hypothetical protein